MMKHTYKISGMTCSGCEAKIKFKLENYPGISEAKVSKELAEAEITMDKHIPFSELKNLIENDNQKYKIEEKENVIKKEIQPISKSWFATYKPILLIFIYITFITFLVQINNPKFDWMLGMQHFMAGFFLVFSFFKMLNLKAFAESYAMYDIVAKKIPVWGYIYAFIELALGISFLIGFNPLLTNAITFTVMTMSIVGVLQSVLNKRKIQCACLGAVFDLPMSTVTIIEDALMILMSLSYLLMVIL